MVLAGRYSVVAMSTRTAPLNLSHRVRSGKLRVKLLLHVGGMSLANVSRSFTCVVVPPQFPTICRQPWRSIEALTKDLHRDIRLTQPLAPLNTFSPALLQVLSFTSPERAMPPHHSLPKTPTSTIWTKNKSEASTAKKSDDDFSLLSTPDYDSFPPVRSMRCPFFVLHIQGAR
jgi:hypothetical protein